MDLHAFVQITKDATRRFVSFEVGPPGGAATLLHMAATTLLITEEGIKIGILAAPVAASEAIRALAEGAGHVLLCHPGGGLTNPFTRSSIRFVKEEGNEDPLDELDVLLVGGLDGVGARFVEEQLLLRTAGRVIMFHQGADLLPGATLAHLGKLGSRLTLLKIAEL